MSGRGKKISSPNSTFGGVRKLNKKKISGNGELGGGFWRVIRGRYLEAKKSGRGSCRIEGSMGGDE